MRPIDADLFKQSLENVLEKMDLAGESQVDIADGLKRALRLLGKQPEIDAVGKMNWISTDHKIPETDGLVLAIVSGKFKNITFVNAIELAEYTDSGWIIDSTPEWDNANVSYWMPLPELPDESARRIKKYMLKRGIQ